MFNIPSDALGLFAVDVVEVPPVKQKRLLTVI